jgi:hypothetical protein
MSSFLRKQLNSDPWAPWVGHPSHYKSNKKTKLYRKSIFSSIQGFSPTLQYSNDFPFTHEFSIYFNGAKLILLQFITKHGNVCFLIRYFFYRQTLFEGYMSHFTDFLLVICFKVCFKNLIFKISAFSSQLRTIENQLYFSEKPEKPTKRKTRKFRGENSINFPSQLNIVTLNIW